MLSILIPTYNYNITRLVEEMHKQCTACTIEFEILVYDDGSKSKLNLANQTVNSLMGCTFKELPNNLGRSAIRNLLAHDAQFEYLIFLDADTFPETPKFIQSYITNVNKKFLYGGVINEYLAPNKPYKLRWLYTKKRESKSVSSANFFIQKQLFLTNPFDETLRYYGYEDVLFFDTMQNKGHSIHYIKNAVIHAADDDASTFIMKTEQAIENLLFLIHAKKLNPKKQKLYRFYSTLKRLKLDFITYKCFKIVKPLLLKNFNSSRPSIVLFDLYRIGYFCSIKHN